MASNDTAGGPFQGGSAADRPRLAVVLASASPRRRTLLSEAGLEFTVDPADVDETLADGPSGPPAPEDAAVELALRKARAVADRRRGQAALVIGSDTVVALERELLGKPVDAAEARAMLSALSGSRHRVVTGVAVVRASDGAESAACERTWVSMRALSEDEIDAYVASGEWRDKAGGYAIQETADRFVTGLEEGGFDNVVGLPVGLTLELLRAVDQR